MSAMRPTTVVGCTAATALGSLLCLPPVSADDVQENNSLSNAFRQGWIQVGLSSGRIVLNGSRGVNYSTTSGTSDRQERLAIRMSGRDPVVDFEMTTADEQVAIDFQAANRLVIRRTPKGNSKVPPVDFRQPANDPIALKVGDKDHEKVYQAASLWHLMVLEPSVCREHLTPLLRLMQRDWDFNKMAEELDERLLCSASGTDLPDRQHWSELVRQLGDNRFSTREAADRKLRAAGQVIVTYLQQLDPSRLDAEQQYRVRRILLALTETNGDDSPDQVAAWLSGDTAIWLALLSRDDDKTRRAAAQHLEALLGSPISFDPDADAATRAQQIEQLRTRLAAVGDGVTR
jgi:hypothetical protein